MLTLITALLQGGRDLELLKGITGVFRPGVLTALMGENLNSVRPQRFSSTYAANACTDSARPYRVVMCQQPAGLPAPSVHDGDCKLQGRAVPAKRHSWCACTPCQCRLITAAVCHGR
jgi:hypothetical protein